METNNWGFTQTLGLGTMIPRISTLSMKTLRINPLFTGIIIVIPSITILRIVEFKITKLGIMTFSIVS
jgi:hypothetical protein